MSRKLPHRSYLNPTRSILGVQETTTVTFRCIDYPRAPYEVPIDLTGCSTEEATNAILMNERMKVPTHGHDPLFAFFAERGLDVWHVNQTQTFGREDWTFKRSGAVHTRAPAACVHEFELVFTGAIPLDHLRQVISEGFPGATNFNSSIKTPGEGRSW